MLNIFDLSFDGKEHYGIDDAYNQARIGLKLIEMGYIFREDMVEPL